MQRRRQRSLLLALLIGAGLLGGWAQAEDAPRQELQRITQSLQRLQTWLDSSREDRATLDAELKASAQALGRLARRVRAAESELQQTQTSVTRLRQEVADLQNAEAQQRDALAAGLRSAWLLGRAEPMQLLLNAEAPDRVGRLLTYQRYVTSARRHLIDDYRATSTRLQERVGELATREARLQRDRDALAGQQDNLQQARDQRAAALRELDTEIEAGEGRVEELSAARSRLRALLQELETRQPPPRLSDFAATRGQLPWPVRNAPVRSAFGSPTAQGKLRSDGVFLETPAGREVQAVHPGRVVFADWMRGFGLIVILDHGGGYMSLYAQTEALLHQAGDWVEAGEAIATAGQSLAGERAGVYFEIRHEGQPQDPAKWCSAPARG